MSGAGYKAVLSENIQRDVWHKYITIATISGITTLMRSSIGPIIADPHAHAVCRRLLAEVVAIAKASGAPVSEDVEEKTYKTILGMFPGMKASMLLDLEKGLAVETDHLHGALLQSVDPKDFPILQAVYGMLSVYSASRLSAVIE
jgi:2-dehydropantoate 2-reductase